MIKKIILINIMFLLVACDNIGNSKVKNIIDLTNKLDVEINENVIFTNAHDEEKLFANYLKFKNPHISHSNIIAEPVIAKKVIYSLNNSGELSAYSIDDEKILWVTSLKNKQKNVKIFNGGVSYCDQKLYVTDGTRDLIIIDALNGLEISRKQFPDLLRTKPIIVDNEIIVLQTVSNQLIAYNQTQSKFVWTQEAAPEIISMKNTPSLLLHNKNIIACFNSGEIMLMDAYNGTEKWILSLSALNDSNIPVMSPAVVTSTPIIDNNYLYASTSNGKIIKLKLSDGSLVWARDAQDVQGINIIDNNIVITNNARQAAILSNDNGKVKWVGELISAKERLSKRPKPVEFLKAFISKDHKARYTINIADKNGALYQFKELNRGNFEQKPSITKIANKLISYWISCCNGQIYLIEQKKVKY